MKLLLVFSLSLISFFLQAEPNKCIPLVKNNPNEISSRIAFPNSGGMFHSGVCWWHSRLQRSAFYLTTFKPELPKPNKRQVRNILRKIRYMIAVAEIPGYKNFYDFSLAYKKEIQKVLNRWQMSDSILYFQWVRGVISSNKVDTESYNKRMSRIYHKVKSSKYINWTLLQLPGLPSHAYLILDMELVGVNKYKLKVIDSNRPLVVREISEDVQLPLFLGFGADIQKLKRVRTKTCND